MEAGHSHSRVYPSARPSFPCPLSALHSTHRPALKSSLVTCSALPWPLDLPTLRASFQNRPSSPGLSAAGIGPVLFQVLILSSPFAIRSASRSCRCLSLEYLGRGTYSRFQVVAGYRAAANKPPPPTAFFFSQKVSFFFFSLSTETQALTITSTEPSPRPVCDAGVDSPSQNLARSQALSRARHLPPGLSIDGYRIHRRILETGDWMPHPHSHPSDRDQIQVT